jgi:hypothetical protein
MRKRTFVLVLIAFLTLVAGAFAMHRPSARGLHHWLGSIHGGR